MQNITKTKAQHKTEKKNMVMFPGNCIYIFLLSSGFLSMLSGSIIAAWIIFGGSFFSMLVVFLMKFT